MDPILPCFKYNALKPSIGLKPLGQFERVHVRVCVCACVR